MKRSVALLGAVLVAVLLGCCCCTAAARHVATRGGGRSLLSNGIKADKMFQVSSGRPREAAAGGGGRAIHYMLRWLRASERASERHYAATTS